MSKLKTSFLKVPFEILFSRLFLPSLHLSALIFQCYSSAVRIEELNCINSDMWFLNLQRIYLCFVSWELQQKERKALIESRPLIPGFYSPDKHPARPGQTFIDQ